ncbi:RelA/SpoT domain-containing protein [Vibrio sp. 10N.261.49.A5]|uniref:RelA/SpoT domain-containing protein n=1 Tax=Vibrio tasmaniensis 1F-267 TaxID=1191324 RepID=A0ABX3B3Z7_9VIBR|nr:RelA/SpoT domain-containing protein [Vibrio tasmaniensis]OEF44708.1 hypothetical protein A163_10890 [Vibrio tasmaniensis 1F-267]
MSENNQSVVSFRIDDTPSAKQSAKNFHDDFSLDFHEFLEQSAKETVEDLDFSNKSVQKAGRKLRKREGDLKQATSVIQTFRTAHEKPLNTIAYLIGRCCREYNIPVKPVKRLKRLETIIDKLQRKSLDGKKLNQTCVTNMNDIGGCRTIFPDMTSLNLIQNKLTETLKGENRVRIKDIDDYITSPKENDCGYRSLHIIYQYEHASGKKFKIEAQLRTRLQHIWATTVEIIDILESTNIKTHSHAPDKDKTNKQIKWEKLLALMSQHIADTEGAITLTASQKLSNALQLQELNDELCAVTRLTSFKMMSENIEADPKVTKGHVLLVVNEFSMEVAVQKVFENQAQATSVYNEMERIVGSINGISTLLVSTQNLGDLADAYPNYIGDCASFIEVLCQAKNYKK